MSWHLMAVNCGLLAVGVLHSYGATCYHHISTRIYFSAITAGWISTAMNIQTFMCSTSHKLCVHFAFHCVLLCLDTNLFYRYSLALFHGHWENCPSASEATLSWWYGHMKTKKRTMKMWACFMGYIVCQGCFTRSRYQGQGQVITSHSICGM